MSTDPIIRRKVDDTFFIHNVFGSFFSGVLDWFADDFYNRFEYKIIGTFDKSIKFFMDKKKQGIDPNGKLLPSISLDPMLDFSPADVGGRQLWQYQNLAPGLGMRMYPKGIDLKEQDVYINVVFTRYQGTFETTFWLSSIYELLDFRTYLLQTVGGYNRWIRPKYFWTSLILPDTVENYEFEDGKKIDWSNSTADLIHVNTINKHRLALPIALDPMWKLDSFADSSTKYGGDQIAEYKLSASWTYEVNIPTYVVTSRGMDPKILLSFSLGTSNTKYPLASPYRILQSIANITPDIVERSKFNNYTLYKISDSSVREKILFSEDSLKYPDKLVNWNHIVSGTLISVTPEWLSDSKNVVTKNDIIFINSYQESLLHSIRRCAGVICKNDTKSGILYSKCVLLKKPLLSNISDEEYELLSSLFNTKITMDSMTRKIFEGVLESESCDISDDPAAAFDIVESIKNKNPEIYNAATAALTDVDQQTSLSAIKLGSVDTQKMTKRLIQDNCDGIQKTFYFGYLIDSSSIPSLLIYNDEILLIQDVDYVVNNNNTMICAIAPSKGSNLYIGGEFLTIKNSQLVSTYEFTEDDITSTVSKILILPEKMATNDDVVLVSYIGRLEQGRDYNLDLENKTIELLLKPIVGEIVQVFLYL